MIIGQAAGVAAKLAIASKKPVQEIDVAALIARLKKQGTTFEYVPNHQNSAAATDKAVVSRGADHGLRPPRYLPDRQWRRTKISLPALASCGADSPPALTPSGAPDSQRALAPCGAPDSQPALTPCGAPDSQPAPGPERRARLAAGHVSECIEPNVQCIHTEKEVGCWITFIRGLCRQRFATW